MKEYYFYTRGLTVGYGGVPLIRDISLSLKKGEILTLIGPNGAGKTTILKSIIRQLAPMAGTVYLDGSELGSMRARELSRRMSVVLTGRVRTELMTCEEVVETGRYPYTGAFGILSEADRRMVRESMERIRILDLAKRDFMQISDGQRQRVMLARAICQEPEVLVLDEPTSFLDIRYKLEFFDILQEMSRREKLTVIMSLHELDFAARVSDRIACVKGDAIDRFGTPEEIFAEGYIARLYDIEEEFCDMQTISPELRAVRGTPQVFVLAGNGAGTPVFRRLQRQGIPFAAGILWENDLDYPAAKALASEVVSVRPFCRIDDGALNRARALIDSCREVICAVDQNLSGEFARELRSLLSYAEEKGKPVSRFDKKK
ncbi:MAG: ABC transporter ATP-binding protein [Clostridiales bacterium]|nr:ABC transporter ATP-binding protein [Clostridiales bacterium]